MGKPSLVGNIPTMGHQTWMDVVGEEMTSIETKIFLMDKDEASER
jgi:hypothetical protein